MKGKVLIIGAGGVGSVVTQKCAQNPDIFTEICLASKTYEKCEKIRDQLRGTIQIAQTNADNVSEVVDLIEKFKPKLVINVALPYQDLPIMEACFEAGVNYLDTANYEPKEVAKFEYKWQWDYHERYEEKGIMALLGSGFDPGVTNVFCAYAQKHLFDEIKTIDIMDCNAGDHGHPFATNFNPEINIREITQKGLYWEKGEWKETEPLQLNTDFDYPEVGVRKSYLLYHEEEESLVKYIKGLERIRFWMTFSEEYLTHLRVLQNVGLTRIDEVIYEGVKIVPLRFLKSLLPDPSTLSKNYKGKTVIGCVISGIKDGNEKCVFIYNITDHAECYKEVKSQAISYTAGVGAVVGAMLMMQGVWKGKGVFNMEQFDPDPFMEKLKICGLPWKIIDSQKLR